MKTVQQHLEELDRNQLLDCFFYDHPMDYGLPVLRELTASQIRQKYLDGLTRFIDLLLNIEYNSDEGHTGILFAYKCMGDREWHSIDCGLVYVDEIIKDGINAPVYSYELSNLEEIVGFLISDNVFTQKHIYEVVSDVLYRASFYGLNIEERNKAIDEIMESLKKAEKGDSVSLDEIKGLFQDEYGYDFEEDAADEEELRSAAYATIISYNKLCMKKEMMSILNDGDLRTNYRIC